MGKFWQPRTEQAPDDFGHGAVKIGTVAAPVIAERDQRRSVLIQNLSANDVYVGGSGVTTSNGILLQPEGAITVYTRKAVYAIATGEASDVRYLEEYHG